MITPELLSPAGNLTKLQIALNYGADAVYASVGSLSLRQRSAKEFNIETFKQGIDYTHKMGAKFYATLNAFPFNGQIDIMQRYIKDLGEMGVDAFIIATPGVIEIAKNLAPNVEIHLSTQANVMNYLDASLYHKMGAKRIVLAREVSLKDAILIKEKNPDLELEIFVHGSMCFAYSGRCLVSALQSGRYSNRGACANDCRFKYEIYAKSTENNTIFRLDEDENGTNVMNAKDLNLASHIDEIVRSGAIDSFKIEGRTKSEYYVACATKAYKMAISDALKGDFDARRYQDELETLKNRGFTDGYLVNRPYSRSDTQNLKTSIEEGSKQVHAISIDGEFLKTKFKIDKLNAYEIFAPQNAQIPCVKNEIGEIFEQNGKKFVKFNQLITAKNKEFEEIHSGNVNEIKLPIKLPNFVFLRKEI